MDKIKLVNHLKAKVTLMTPYPKTPIYNLSVVIRETGLKADLVRAWERRYDLPKPHRSKGGHRLYSQYDVEVLKWLREKQTQGLSISNAVELWRSLEDEGLNPLDISEENREQEFNSAAPFYQPVAELRQSWITACVNFDSPGAEDAINQAFSSQSIETVVMEILEKGMHEIGQGWHAGRFSVQQEHFASSLAERRLQTLLSLTPAPTRPQTVLLGCPPGELHSLPVTILDLFLRRKGFNVIYLGANIPLDQMVATALRLHPGLIILAAQTLETAASLLDTFTSLYTSNIPLAYGGLIFNRVPDLCESIPAHFLGENLQTAVEQAATLLIHGKGRPVNPVKVNLYSGLERQFQENRGRIELLVQERMVAAGLSVERIAESNHFFGAELSAALKLGDPAYIETDLDWVMLLLKGRNIHGAHLIDYLKVYRESIEEHMGSEAAPITRWLGQYTVD